MWIMLTAPQCRNDCGRRGLGFRGAQELKESGADKILYDPLELLPFSRNTHSSLSGYEYISWTGNQRESCLVC